MQALNDVDGEFRKELREYIDQISRIRNEHIQALMVEYYERKEPDPEDVVLVEQHDGLQTIWFFSTKQKMEMTGNEMYNK